MKSNIKVLIILFCAIIAMLIIKSLLITNNKELALGDSLIGDIDGNGKVGATDYILVRKHILGSSKLTGKQLEIADVNSDGKISSLDYVIIRKTIIDGVSIIAKSTETAKPTAVETVKPTTKTTIKKYKKQFEITHWWGIYSDYMDETQVQYLKDAGFTLVWVHNRASGISADEYKKSVGSALEKLNKYGLKAIVVPYKYIISGNESQEERKKRTLEMINDYSKYPNVMEYFLTDEPGDSSMAKSLGELVDLIHKNDPGADGYYNFLPKGAVAGDYKNDYIIPFAKKVNNYTISFDRYVFPASGGVDKANYYDNLSDIYSVGEKYNKIGTSIVLLTPHKNFKDVSRDEIAFQISVSLAFGMKRISYFTYSLDDLASGHPSDKYRHAIVDENHNRTSHYYDVQSVNKWTIKIGNQLFDKKNVGVFGFNEVSTITNYNTYDKGITASKAGIISMFSDKSYLLVNTEIANPQNNTFTFSSLSGLSYFNTSNGKWVNITGDVKNDNFSISYSKNQIVIKPGYCVLIKGGNFWKKSPRWEKDSSGKWRYYDPDGNLVKSDWVLYKGAWYYIGADGVMLTGWQEIKWSGGTNWFYFDETGAMVANSCKTINGEKFCFNNSGACYSGRGC